MSHSDPNASRRDFLKSTLAASLASTLAATAAEGAAADKPAADATSANPLVAENAKPGAVRKSKTTQQQLVQDWMKKSVPSTNGKFFYPKDYQQILTSCQEIIEEPLFLPTFAFSNIEELKKAAVRGNL